MNNQASINDTKKRHHSPAIPSPHEKEEEKETASKRQQIDPSLQDEEGDLLTRLNSILTEIKTTPSTGEISANLLGQLRHLMLRIEELAADETNIEARQLKDESDKYLELWFEDLVAQCDADGELDWNLDEEEEEEYSDDDEESIALAMALQDEEDAVQVDDGSVMNQVGFVEEDDLDEDDLVPATAPITGGY